MRCALRTLFAITTLVFAPNFAFAASSPEETGDEETGTLDFSEVTSVSSKIVESTTPIIYLTITNSSQSLVLQNYSGDSDYSYVASVARTCERAAQLVMLDSSKWALSVTYTSPVTVSGTTYTLFPNNGDFNLECTLTQAE